MGIESRYAYEADHDYVAKDWERAIEAHTHARPVVYNNSMVKGKGLKRVSKTLKKNEDQTITGSFFGMQLRKRRLANRSLWSKLFPFERRPRPAKIRYQKLKIRKEYGLDPYKLTLYEIDKVSRYPSLAERRKAAARERAAVKRRRELMYPPAYVHYNPMG